MRTSQLYTSHRSYIQPFELQDALSLYVQRVGGWFSTHIDSVVYTVPQEYDYMLYMFDPNLQRCPHEDWYL